MKTTQVNGKPYVKVEERVKYLSSAYEMRYSVDTNYEHFPERRLWIVKATLTLTDANGNRQTYTGLAQEVESDNPKQTNYASALENAETSALGRACAAAGIGIADSYASADEVQKANDRKPVKRVPQTMEEHTEERLRMMQEKKLANSPATVKQKTEILLLLNREGITEQEKTRMIENINSLTQSRAIKAIRNLEQHLAELEYNAA